MQCTVWKHAYKGKIHLIKCSEILIFAIYAWPHLLQNCPNVKCGLSLNQKQTLVDSKAYRSTRYVLLATSGSKQKFLYTYRTSTNRVLWCTYGQTMVIVLGKSPKLLYFLDYILAKMTTILHFDRLLAFYLRWSGKSLRELYRTF